MAEVATSQPEPFTDEVARYALTRACRFAGITARSVELIRMGSNAVFRLDRDVIARVAPTTRLLANAKKQINVARWLESVGYPAARASAVTQPVEAEGCIVTFWKSVSRETVYAPIGEVATLIKRLHALETPTGVDLLALRPLGAPDEELPALRRRAVPAAANRVGP